MEKEEKKRKRSLAQEAKRKEQTEKQAEELTEQTEEPTEKQAEENTQKIGKTAAKKTKSPKAKGGFREKMAAWQRLLERKIDKFRAEQVRKSKQNLRMRKKMSTKDYTAYRLQKLKEGEWKQLLAAVLFLLLLLFLIARIITGIAGAIGKLAGGNVGETEVETESETEKKVYVEADITVGSTGCMLLHSPFIDSYPDENGNYDFSSIYTYITPYYSEPDFMTCEFEGALAGEEMGYSGYPTFKSPDVIIENIRDSGVDLQMLATNHIYDAWSDGFRRTMEVYEQDGIAYTGIRQSTEDKPYYIADINGVEVGFIDYVYETDGEGVNLNGLSLAEDDQDLINTFKYDELDAFYAEMASNIAAMKEDGARFIIADMHWGTEYQLEESDYQDEMAQKLCNLGVDAIIGGHPHCEQPIDVFTSEDGENTMFCIFSEGNALSNQRTYLMDEMPTGHTEDGVMVTLSLHQDMDGTVSISDVDILPTWVYRYEDDGSKYFILPLDDVDNIETTTGIDGIGEDAKASYERTMEELGPGLEKAKEAFGASKTEDAVNIGI